MSKKKYGFEEGTKKVGKHQREALVNRFDEKLKGNSLCRKPKK